MFDKLSSTQELDQSCNIKHEDYKKEVSLVFTLSLLFCHFNSLSQFSYFLKVYTQDAYTLLSLGVLDHEGNVTRFGLMMKRLQVGPMLARMIESSEKYGCGEEIIKIAAMVSSRANAHRTPVSRSDHMSMLVAYESWEATNFSKKWCLDNGVQVFFIMSYIYIYIYHSRFGVKVSSLLICSLLKWSMPKVLSTNGIRLWRVFR